jgi:hypothetical protein
MNVLGPRNVSTVLAITLALLAAAAAPAQPAEHADQLQRGDGPRRELRLSDGAQKLRFSLRRPAGVVLTFRLTLPKGTRAYLTGRIGGIAGVMISTDHDSCTTIGRKLVCEQQVEWCPLPHGTWGFRLHKLAGPAGRASLVFRIGTPPHRTHA